MSPDPFSGIQDLLSRYRKYLSESDEQHKKIIEIIHAVSGIALSQGELLLLKGEIHITGNSVLKNELFLHKEQILEALHKNGLTNIVEIH